MFWNKKGRVKVSFVDIASGAVFAQSEMAAESLPESFEAQTTLSVKGQAWEVVSAAPMTRAAYTKSGALRLEVRKVEVHVSAPDEILFSLPTICDVIPPVARGSSKIGKSVVELNEDDYRQVELVARDHRAAVDACIAKISALKAQATPAGAFKEIHVRTEIATPLPGSPVSLDALVAAFSPLEGSYDGVAYERVAGLVEGGFAFRATGSLVVYGVVSASGPVAVGLSTRKVAQNVVELAPKIAELMAARGLLLIDWCGTNIIEAKVEDVLAFLQSHVSDTHPQA